MNKTNISTLLPLVVFSHADSLGLRCPGFEISEFSVSTLIQCGKIKFGLSCSQTMPLLLYIIHRPHCGLFLLDILSIEEKVSIKQLIKSSADYAE